jgi:hypothetical protein
MWPSLSFKEARHELGISLYETDKNVFGIEDIKNTLSEREGKQVQESNVIKQKYLDVGM